MDKLTLDDGRFLVELARKAVEEFLYSANRIEPPPDTPAKLREPRGVFVTIEKVVERESEIQHILRGCIGFPEPVKPLVEATIEAAIAAAIEDPRFAPLTEDELDYVIFEVSVLTKPKEVKYEDPDELPRKIEVGRHGIIIESGFYRGLLLPQVAVENEWNAVEFLQHACYKAALYRDCWKSRGVKVYVFEAQIFAEVSPRGEIVERLLFPTKI